MDTNSYVKRMESAVLRANEAMKIMRTEAQKLRDDNAKLTEEKAFLQKRVSELESGLNRNNPNHAKQDELPNKLSSQNKKRPWDGLSLHPQPTIGKWASLATSSSKSTPAPHSTTMHTSSLPLPSPFAHSRMNQVSFKSAGNLGGTMKAISETGNASSVTTSSDLVKSSQVLVKGVVTPLLSSPPPPSKRRKQQQSENTSVVDSADDNYTTESSKEQAAPQPRNDSELRGCTMKDSDLAAELDLVLDDADIFGFSDDDKEDARSETSDHSNRSERASLFGDEAEVESGTDDVEEPAVSVASDFKNVYLDTASNQGSMCSSARADTALGSSDVAVRAQHDKDLTDINSPAQFAKTTSTPLSMSMSKKDLKGWKSLGIAVPSVGQGSSRKTGRKSVNGKRREEPAVEPAELTGAELVAALRAVLSAVSPDNVYSAAEVLRRLPYTRVVTELVAFLYKQADKYIDSCDASWRTAENIGREQLSVGGTLHISPDHEPFLTTQLLPEPLLKVLDLLVELCGSLLLGKMPSKVLVPGERYKAAFLAQLRLRSIAFLRRAKGDLGILGALLGSAYAASLPQKETSSASCEKDDEGEDDIEQCEEEFVTSVHETAVCVCNEAVPQREEEADQVLAAKSSDIQNCTADIQVTTASAVTSTPCVTNAQVNDDHFMQASSVNSACALTAVSEERENDTSKAMDMDTELEEALLDINAMSEDEEEEAEAEVGTGGDAESVSAEEEAVAVTSSLNAEHVCTKSTEGKSSQQDSKSTGTTTAAVGTAAVANPVKDARDESRTEIQIASLVLFICKLAAHVGSPSTVSLFMLEAITVCSRPSVGLLLGLYCSLHANVHRYHFQIWLGAIFDSLAVKNYIQVPMTGRWKGFSDVLRDVLSRMEQAGPGSRNSVCRSLSKSLVGDIGSNIVDEVKLLQEMSVSYNSALNSIVKNASDQESVIDSSSFSDWCVAMATAFRSFGIFRVLTLFNDLSMLKCGDDSMTSKVGNIPGDAFLVFGTINVNATARVILSLANSCVRTVCQVGSADGVLFGDTGLALVSEIPILSFNLVNSINMKTVESETLSAISSSSRGGKVLIGHFRSHWLSYLTVSESSCEPQTLKEIFREKLHRIVSTTHLFRSLLHALVEYDSLSMGWRLDGNREGSADSPEGKLYRTVNLVRSTFARLGPYIPVPTSSATWEGISTANQWLQQPLLQFNLTNFTVNTIESAVYLLDYVLSHWSVWSTTYRFDIINTKLVAEARKGLLTILGLLGVALIERLIAVVSCSVCALLQVFSEPHETFKIMDDISFCSIKSIVINESIRLVMTIPPPWAGHWCVTTAMTIIHATKSVYSSPCRTLSVQTTNLQCIKKIPKDVGRWLQAVVSQTPAIVINLDRRSDRWRRCLRMCLRAEVLPLRLSAVDGKSLVHNGVEVLSASEVCVYWDSTLNAKFDRQCVVNKATSMTNSERACSASHIRAWRLIDDIFKHNPSVGGRGCGGPIESAINLIGGMHSTDMQWEHAMVKAACFLTGHGTGWQAKQSSTPFSAQGKRACGGVQKKEYMLVLEDDAGFLEDETGMPFRCRIGDVVNSLPEDCDICYLGYVLPWSAQELTFKKGFLQPTYLWQLHAYLLSGSGARKLLANLPVDCPVDNFVAKLIFYDKIKAYAVKDKMVRQVAPRTGAKRSGDSDIVHSGHTTHALR